MTKKLFAMTLALGIGTFALSTRACPDEKSHDHSKVQKVSDEVKAPCSGHKAAKTVADESSPCANCPGCKNCKGGCKKGVTVADSAEASERVETVLAKLPKITFKIGDEQTCCRMSAKKLAEKSDKPIQYIVGDEVFEDESEAVVELTSVLEKELEAMTAMQYSVAGDCMRCPMTAKKVAAEKHAKLAYRVAGFDFEEKAEADKAVKLASDAADSVKISYKVGDSSFGCDKMAGAKAKEAGASIVYVVGDEETPCDKHAALLLTQARIRAIVAAAAAIIAL